METHPAVLLELSIGAADSFLSPHEWMYFVAEAVKLKVEMMENIISPGLWLKLSKWKTILCQIGVVL